MSIPSMLWAKIRVPQLDLIVRLRAHKCPPSFFGVELNVERVEV